MAWIILAIGPVPVNLVNEITTDVWLIEERKTESFKIVPSLWAKRSGTMETSEEKRSHVLSKRAFEVVVVDYRCRHRKPAKS